MICKSKKAGKPAKNLLIETTDIKKFQKRTDKAIRVLAFFTAKKGQGKKLERTLLDLVGQTREESGNISYVLHRSTENPDELIFDEIWQDIHSLELHFEKPYIVSLDDKVKSLIAKPIEVKTYAEVT